jgi:predicted  nucleic acid-binding Zn-ribbon protein
MKDVVPKAVKFSKEGPVVFEVKCPYCGKLRYSTAARIFSEYEKYGPEQKCDSCRMMLRMPELAELRRMNESAEKWKGDGDEDEV